MEHKKNVSGGGSVRKKVKATGISQKKYEQIREKYKNVKLTPTKFGPLLAEFSEDEENDTEEYDSDLEKQALDSDSSYKVSSDEEDVSDADSVEGIIYSEHEEDFGTPISPDVRERERERERCWW